MSIPTPGNRLCMRDHLIQVTGKETGAELLNERQVVMGVVGLVKERSQHPAKVIGGLGGGLSTRLRSRTLGRLFQTGHELILMFRQVFFLLGHARRWKLEGELQFQIKQNEMESDGVSELAPICACGNA